MVFEKGKSYKTVGGWKATVVGVQDDLPEKATATAMMVMHYPDRPDWPYYQLANHNPVDGKIHSWGMSANEAINFYLDRHCFPHFGVFVGDLTKEEVCGAAR